MVKASTNSNKNQTLYCCNIESGFDGDCCNSPVPGLERWNFGSKDVHGTAFILNDGSFSSMTETSDGKYSSHAEVGIQGLNGY